MTVDQEGQKLGRFLATRLKWLGLVVTVLMVVSCSSDGKDIEPGTEGGPCLKGQICNTGLNCLSNLCVRLPQKDLAVDLNVMDQKVVLDTPHSDTNTSDLLKIPDLPSLVTLHDP